ncbi:hypothetical protein J2785_005084 [Burkholderia ambifaria]|nr:hypothetical protein [Burkholderia ambifaria]
MPLGTPARKRCARNDAVQVARRLVLLFDPDSHRLAEHVLQRQAVTVRKRLDPEFEQPAEFVAAVERVEFQVVAVRAVEGEYAIHVVASSSNR